MRAIAVTASDVPELLNPGNASLARAFVGREEEVEQLGTLLRQPAVRLVTLTGPGGVGKTRLAMRVAELVESDFESGTHFISLAALDDPALVAPAIGQAFELGGHGDTRLADRIASAIAGQSLLMVVDNFERVVEAAPILVQLLEAAPLLKILVTSRCPLRLSIEQEIEVRPFPLAEATASDDQIDHSPGVRLFRQSATVKGDLIHGAAAQQEHHCIAAICRRLEGLPLAIELAAAQTRMMSPCELFDRLVHRLPWLELGPRDKPLRLQTMRNAIAWSYDMLNDDQHGLFRALSVFPGGFTVESATAIAAIPQARSPRNESDNTVDLKSLDQAAVFNALRSLLDASLVSRRDAITHRVRFGMLETIREFGREELSNSGREEEILRRHAEFFGSGIKQPDILEMSRPFGSAQFAFPDDEDNLRAALNWAFDHREFELASRLTWALSPFWKKNALITEARTAIDRILALADPSAVELRAGWSKQGSELAWYQTDAVRALELASVALGLYRQIGQKAGIAASLHELGSVYKCLDRSKSAELFSQAAGMFRELGNEPARIRSLYQLGWARISQGDLGQAKAAFHEALDCAKAWGDGPAGDPTASDNLIGLAWFGVGWMKLLEGHPEDARKDIEVAHQRYLATNERYGEQTTHRLLGRIARLAGELELAADHLREAYRIIRQLGSFHAESYCLAEIAAIAAGRGDHHDAARMLGAEWRIRFQIKLHLMPDESAVVDLAEKRVRSVLGGEVFELAFEQGNLLSATAVYEEAMSLLQPRSSCPPSELSRRELEVIHLIADGLTNLEIAASLFISKRTVDGHVVGILTKLNAASRREAVVIARERGLLAAPAAGLKLS